MKKTCAVLNTLMVWLGATLVSYAQNWKEIEMIPERLTISANKTTNLIFPYPIKSGDCGSKDVLVQKAVGVENILQLKAGKIGFEETNLSVVTNDGALYSFILNYALIPSEINFKAERPMVKPSAVAVFSEDATTDKIRQRTNLVAGKKRTIKNIRDINNGVVLDLKGFYYSDGICYLQLYLQNFSIIDYDIKMLKLYYRDVQKSKRTASQEIEIQPIHSLGNVKMIKGNSEQTLVVALNKFTIPDKKRLDIELMEKDGGRNLHIHFGNKTIMNAHTIN